MRKNKQWRDTLREHLAEYWHERAMERREAVASWSTWPDGHLFLGQRGPLNERGIREIIAKLGQAAKLVSPLGPHDLRHTLPSHYLIQQPMDWIGSLCRSQRFSNCWVTLISRQRPFTRGSLLMTLLG